MKFVQLTCAYSIDCELPSEENDMKLIDTANEVSTNIHKLHVLHHLA